MPKLRSVHRRKTIVGKNDSALSMSEWEMQVNMKIYTYRINMQLLHSNGISHASRHISLLYARHLPYFHFFFVHFHIVCCLLFASIRLNFDLMALSFLLTFLHLYHSSPPPPPTPRFFFVLSALPAPLSLHCLV